MLLDCRVPLVTIAMAASPQQVNGRGWNGSWTPPPSCSAAGYFVTLLSALLHFWTKFDAMAAPLPSPSTVSAIHDVQSAIRLTITLYKYHTCIQAQSLSFVNGNQLSPRLRNNEAMNHNLCSSISNEWTTTNIPLFHLVSHSKEEEDASPLGSVLSPHFRRNEGNTVVEGDRKTTMTPPL